MLKYMVVRSDKIWHCSIILGSDLIVRFRRLHQKKAQNLMPNIKLRVTTKSRRHHPCSESSDPRSSTFEAREESPMSILSISQCDSAWFYPNIRENKKMKFSQLHPSAESCTHGTHPHKCREKISMHSIFIYVYFDVSV